MEGNTPGTSRRTQTPLDLDKLLAMTTKWPPYPRKKHPSGHARITIGRRSFYLRGPWNSDASHRHYDELKALWLKGRREGGATLSPRSLTVADAVTAYVEWSRLHQAPSTTYGYRWYGEAFARLHGGVLAAELPRYAVTRWVDEMVSSGRWTSPNTMASAVAALARIFSWCTEEGLLKTNPLAGMKPGKRRSRQRVLTDAEYRSLLRGAHPAFRRLLVALRWTGARPCELRAATFADVQVDEGGKPARIVLAKHKTATTTKVPRPRVIWLVGPMPRLVAWLGRNRRASMLEHPSKDSKGVDTIYTLDGKQGTEKDCGTAVQDEKTAARAVRTVRSEDRCSSLESDHSLASSSGGPQAKTRGICMFIVKNTGEMAGVVDCGPQPLFTTETGRPWSAGRLCQVVGERRRAAGLAADCCSYLLRHGYLTTALVNGVPLTTLAELAGNSPATITRSYSHVASEFAHLEAAARQAVKSNGKAS